MDSNSWLLVDAGGTRTRCILRKRNGETYGLRVLRNADFDRFESALAGYLRDMGARPGGAVIAVAAPELRGEIRFTNNNWSFTVEGLKKRLGLRQLRLVNDFTAVAMSLPVLTDADLLPIGGGRAAAVAGATMAVLGPGTGLGVSGVVPCGDGWAPITGEGGHVTLAASTDAEAQLLSLLRARFGHVSAERLLCGPGLVTLYKGLAELRAQSVSIATPEAVSGLADAGDALATEALAVFFRLLATVASDLALTLGARGGVFLAGGILPQMKERFANSDFRARFEDKGKFREYLARVPTRLIVTEQPALIGLGTLARNQPD